MFILRKNTLKMALQNYKTGVILDVVLMFLYYLGHFYKL